jgi:hypothetical protein
MKKNSLCFSLYILVALFACSKNVEEELNPNNNCITTDISFQNDVTPILSANCFGCHSTSAAFGNIILDNYEEVIKVINDGRFLGAIKHEFGFSPMPKNASQLSECNIDKIASWLAIGAPNN